MNQLRASFELPLVPERAWVLFTAHGERTWVPNWNPHFADSDDDRQPGAVFTTGAVDTPTYWVLTAAEPGRQIAYARVTPGGTAGTVAVTTDSAGDHGDRTRVTVTYRLTALEPGAIAALDTFARSFSEYVENWQRLILAVLPGVGADA